MIDIDDSIWKIWTCPIIGWMTSIMTTAIGALNFDGWSLSSVNSVLATISMFVGICLSLAMLRAWMLKGDLHRMDKDFRNKRIAEKERRHEDQIN